MATLIEHNANLQEGNANGGHASGSAAASVSSGEGSQAGGHVTTNLSGGGAGSGDKEGSYIGEGDPRFVAAEDLQRVQGYIESCLQAYMPQQQVMATLQHHCKVHPSFTATVWQRLEDQNPEFFKMYYLRLKLKDQIVMFNYLLEQQVGMVQKLYASWLQALPPVPPMPSGPNGMNMMGMGMMPPNSMPQHSTGQDGAPFGYNNSNNNLANAAATRMMMGSNSMGGGQMMPGGGGGGGMGPGGMMMNPQMMMMMGGMGGGGGGGGMPMMTGPSSLQHYNQQQQQQQYNQQHVKGAGSTNNSQQNDPTVPSKGRGSAEVNRNEISHHSNQSTGLGAFQLPPPSNHNNHKHNQNHNHGNGNHGQMQNEAHDGADTLEGILNIDEKNFSFAELAAFDMDQVMDDFSLHPGGGGGGREEGQESGKPHQSTPQPPQFNAGRGGGDVDGLQLGGDGFVMSTSNNIATPGLGVFSQRDSDLHFNGGEGLLAGGSNLLNSTPGLGELMDLGGGGDKEGLGGFFDGHGI